MKKSIYSLRELDMSLRLSITSEASNKVPLVKILYDFHLCFSKAVQRTGRAGSYISASRLDMLAKASVEHKLKFMFIHPLFQKLFNLVSGSSVCKSLGFNTADTDG